VNLRPINFSNLKNTKPLKATSSINAKGTKANIQNKAKGIFASLSLLMSNLVKCTIDKSKTHVIAVPIKNPNNNLIGVFEKEGDKVL